MAADQPLVATRAHTVVLAWPIAVAVAAVAVLALVVAVVRAAAHPGAIGTIAALVAGALALAALGRLVRRVWEWDRTVLVVTDDRVVIRRSGLRRSEHIVPLASVHRLRVRRSLAGRALGYGTIEIAGPGRGSRLAFVPRPDDVSAVISTYAGRHRERIG
jgi:hypothetical protein